MDYDKQEREEADERVKLEEDMLTMVSGMKNFARGFQEQFKKDEGVIRQVSSLQTTNIDKTDAEVEKINY